MRKARKINNQPKTLQGILNFIRYIDSVNSYRMIFKVYHTIKYNCYIFEIRKRIEFARPKRITTVEVSLQRIFTIKVIKSLL